MEPTISTNALCAESKIRTLGTMLSKLIRLADAEHRNQGIDSKLIPHKGFGWMNVMYQVGLKFSTACMCRAVAVCPSLEVFLELDTTEKRQFLRL